MALWFGGTSSDNYYQVGQSYSMAGNTYRANEDGSFTNQSSGRTLVGSSQSDVPWYESNASGSSSSAGGPAASPTFAGTGQLFGGTSGPGAERVVVPGTGQGESATPGTGPGNNGVGTPASGGSHTLSVMWQGRPDNVQRGVKQLTIFPDEVSGSSLDRWQLAPTTPLMIGGNQVLHDQGWSDAAQVEDRWGEGELLSPSWFYGWATAANDIAHNVNSKRDELGHQMMDAIDRTARETRERENRMTNEQFQRQAADSFYELRGW